MQSFFCTSWDDDMIFFILCSVNAVNYIGWILDVKPTLHFWHHPSLAASVCWYDASDVCGLRVHRPVCVSGDSKLDVAIHRGAVRRAV